MQVNMNFKKKTISMIMVLTASLPIFGASYNIKDFGAKGDGINLDSKAVNDAIESAFANGGGTVVVPAGLYLCGSIVLKSNINLHLESGAVIIATKDSKAYMPSEEFNFPEYQDGGHTYFHNSLIWAEEQENVSITGHGMIDGYGLTRKDTEKGGVVHGGSIGTGDKAIALKRCKNILIRDITIYRGGHFAIIATGCERGTIDNITVDTNRDGIDIDCCKYLSVTNCKVNTPHDDAIVLKASYALKKAVACEHIQINNCLVTGFKLGTFLDGTYVPEKVNWVCGRIKLGTESNGDYKNINITNCNFMYSSGIALEEVDQGRMENIVVNNLSMAHVHHYPIYITTGCRNRGPKNVTQRSYGGDIMISNIMAQDCDSLAGIIITGMKEEPLRNIVLQNISIEYRGGGNSSLRDKEYREQAKNYPEPRWAGPTPAYGLYARHVDGLYVNNVHFHTMTPDYRHMIILDDVKNENIVNISGPVEKGAKRMLVRN